jgi:hypothetical protein
VAVIKIGQESARSSSLQQTIKDRIKTGKVVPIISNSACNDLVLGSGENARFIRAYAEYVGYEPNKLAGQFKLPHVTQYASIMLDQVPDRIAAKELYINFAKSWMFALAKDKHNLPTHILDEVEEQFDFLNFTKLMSLLGFPNFSQPELTTPLKILASFSLPLYLTTSHHSYIELALRYIGKTPHSAICPWREGYETRTFVLDTAGNPLFDSGFRPDKQSPLVYHLQGFDAYPQSLVLTEDDYLEFLVAISRDKSSGLDPIPKNIREVLSESSLLLMGYQLRSWSFRVLFWGLIKSEVKRMYKSVSVQMAPDEVDERYLQSYLNEANFDVYRGTLVDYLNELNSGLE